MSASPLTWRSTSPMRARIMPVLRRAVRVLCLGILALGVGTGFYWQRGYVANIISATSPESESPAWWMRSSWSAPSPLKAINDPERIRSLLPAGKTELLHTKGGFVGTMAPSDDHWRDRKLQFACVFESLVRRTIESNDGVCIVELRRLESVRIARLFGETKSWQLVLGPPSQVVLRNFPLTSQVGTERVLADRLADAILDGGADALRSAASSAAYLQVDSLSGKTVRITYVDGKGVVSVEPVGCTLSEADRRFLAQTSMVADAHLVPSIQTDGQSARLAAGHLDFLFDPSLRQIFHGGAEVRYCIIDASREALETRVRLVSAAFQSEPDQAGTAEGTLNYGANDGRIRSAFLEVPFTMLSFQSRPASCLDEAVMPPVFDSDCPPAVQLAYSCVEEESVPQQRPAAASPAGQVLCLPGAGQLPSQSRPIAAAAWHRSGGDGPIDVDLAAARLLLLTIATGCFWCGSRIARRGRPGLTAIATATAVGLLVLFSVYVHGCLCLARLLPVSSAIVLGNWIPPGAAFVIGVLSQQRSIPRWRRAILIVALAGLGGSTLADSSCSNEAVPGNQWSADGVCIQTASATCSACSAATLLADRGIPASEPEMARLCLSKETGTPLLGLYRGLKLKTRGTPWEVEIIRCGFDELKRLDNLPAVLSVRLGETDVIGTGKLGQDSGRIAGTCHAVVLFGFLPDGRAEIGDPSQYRHDRGYWPVDQLKSAYMGEGIRLVERRL